ncbi:NAD(P)H-hydrate dehydratase [Paenibacillus abyssi]|uniref:Bifunctional NAD(P)H-hydrate repair enzyme n=1 Tax=Paenibacillus abyssi TaxID=1340531 RepID=A0A917LDQ7_9BACL|nr:NAD(P)H-hydrate dehydratase [Paenibacillus abyssi]GGG14390.1 bifunctional NAD(P)H-hydrate repair enzyme Nnr [Paenibacillus abyssi]
MYIVTAQEMRAMEEHMFHEIGISALVLMENAGRAIAEEAAQFSHRGNTRGSERGFRWLIIVGKGNNGGDGLVSARHLAEMGFGVEILYAVHPDQLRGEAAIQRDIIKKLGITTSLYSNEESNAQEPQWSRWDGIIDALLGTGTSGEPREPYASIIRQANASDLPIVSADIPSGLNADTGEIPGTCIKAALTVALSYCKRGVMIYPGSEAAGEIVVRSIGIPADLARSMGVKTYQLDEATLSRRFGISFPLNRKSDTHKGTYGHVLVAAGSSSMSGAGLLSAKAALRGGSGLVSWAVPEQLAVKLMGLIPEVMIRGIADAGDGQWSGTTAKALIDAAEGKKAVIIGPGLGRWNGDSEWLLELWENVTIPVVVDADALNMMAEDRLATPWPRRSAATVLTPHPGEMARLCGMSTEQVQRDRIGVASSYASQHHVVVVLKGAHSIVASPDGEIYVNTTGNPGMSTGGTGDVLAGIIGSLLGQGMETTQAAALGVYWHGLTGDRAASARNSVASLIASDIIDFL